MLDEICDYEQVSDGGRPWTWPSVSGLGFRRKGLIQRKKVLNKCQTLKRYTSMALELTEKVANVCKSMCDPQELETVLAFFYGFILVSSGLQVPRSSTNMCVFI